jgi:hypothetical protein
VQTTTISTSCGTSTRERRRLHEKKLKLEESLLTSRVRKVIRQMVDVDMHSYDMFGLLVSDSAGTLALIPRSLWVMNVSSLADLARKATRQNATPGSHLLILPLPLSYPVLHIYSTMSGPTPLSEGK